VDGAIGRSGFGADDRGGSRMSRELSSGDMFGPTEVVSPGDVVDWHSEALKIRPSLELDFGLAIYSD